MLNRPQHNERNKSGGIPISLAAVSCVVAFAAAVVVTGGVAMLPTVALLAMIDGACAAAVAVSAGGFGFLAVRKLVPSDSPAGLKVATSCALGLWMFSIAILAVGSLTTGSLTAWVWWPVVGAGIIAAGVQTWPKIQMWNCKSISVSVAELQADFGEHCRAASCKLNGNSSNSNNKDKKQKNTGKMPVLRNGNGTTMPRITYAGLLLGVILAAAGGIWVCGAAQPPGFLGSGTKDYYDILEYHLQTPREFYDAQHISALRHNCYSFYPSTVEMTFLLSMALRGGAYEAMYQANLMHGLWTAIGVLAVVSALRKNHGIAAVGAAVLLATTPGVAYLSALAMNEMAQVACLAIALLWLRIWLDNRSAGDAACLGLSLGVACATKYLAIGFVAFPVLLAMAAVCLRRRAVVRHVLLAGLLTLLPLAPWLARNTIYTGNPVFPLATGIFGRGYWSVQQEQRWLDGHGPADKPPVPVPPGWQERPVTSRTVLFYDNFLAGEWFGMALLIPVGAMITIMLIWRKKCSAWNLSLLGVLAVQIAVWILVTHGMPWRFLIPAVVPMALLGGEALEAIAGWRLASTKKAAISLPIGAIIACTAIVAIGASQLYSSGKAILSESSDGLKAYIPPGEFIANEIRTTANLPAGSRVLLVGDAKAFYFPAGAVYATTFDTQSLAEMAAENLTGPQATEHLRQKGITHIWVDWSEILRLAHTYGYQPPLGGKLCERLMQRRPAGLDILDRMHSAGLVQEKSIGTCHPAGLTWPIVTVYKLTSKD